MLTFVTFPTLSIFTTFPSAGETIIDGSCGMVRCGLRKKNATKDVRNNSKTPMAIQPNPNAAMVSTISGIRNRKASGAIIVMEGYFLSSNAKPEAGASGFAGVALRMLMTHVVSKVLDQRIHFIFQMQLFLFK